MNLHTVRKQCPYCQRQIDLVPPFYRQSPLEFITPCPRDACKKRLLVFALKGRVSSVITPRQFRWASRMLGEPNSYPMVAELMEEACESAYLNSLRAAAVTLRVSAQLFASVAVFGKDPGSTDLPRLRKMIDQLNGRRPPAGLSEVKRRTIATHLTTAARLGDTAAHPVVRLDWQLPPIPSNVDSGITAVEKLIAVTKGWPQ